MVRVTRYRAGGIEVTVTPDDDQQIPSLPLMSVGQFIYPYNEERLRILSVTVDEFRAPEGSPFTFYYVYSYTVEKVDD